MTNFLRTPHIIECARFTKRCAFRECERRGVEEDEENEALRYLAAACAGHAFDLETPVRRTRSGEQAPTHILHVSTDVLATCKILFFPPSS